MMKTSRKHTKNVPPRMAELMVKRFASQQDVETIQGDLEEEFHRVAREHGVEKARRKYWMNTLGLVLPLLRLTLMRKSRVVVRWGGFALKRPGTLALVGLALMIPGLLLCSSGILYSFFGFAELSNALNFNSPFFHPATVLGGLFSGFVINMWSMTNIRYSDGAIVWYLQLRGRLLNLTVAGTMVLLLSVIAVYLVMENA